MAFPNSHAFAFAQLPRGMTKTWYKETLTDNLKPVQNVPNVMKHRHSSIAKIQLSIEFDQVANFMASECNGADDENDDAIELWKENRNLWRDLEKCVEEQIDRYVNSIHANIQTTLNAKSFTFETPTRKKTEIIRSDSHYAGTGKEHCTNTAPDAQTVLTLPDDSRIGPDDSASVLGENYMRQTIDREVEKAIRQASDRLSATLIDAQARKKKNKKHQKHSQRTGSSMFARSVLNYAKT